MSGGFQLRFKFLSPSFDWDIAECLKISPDWKQVKQLQAPNNSNSGTQCFRAFVFIFGNWGEKKKQVTSSHKIYSPWLTFLVIFKTLEFGSLHPP